MTEPVLEIRDLTVELPTEDGTVDAVRGVTLAVAPGEVLAVVGESGAGKSALALAVMGLLPEGARAGGSVRLAGEELVGLDDGALSRVRGRRIAMVFQDPQAALTPVHTVGRQVAEAVSVHSDVGRAAAGDRALELLRLVGVPADRAGAYPHELSGGMRQRVVIAMAMAHDPEVLMADEPTTALDVTVQAQVLDVLEDARRRTGAAMVLVTHDLGVVARTADRVAVLRQGRVVEEGPVADVLRRPRHPHTRELVTARRRLDSALPRPPVSSVAPHATLPVLAVRGLARHHPVRGGLLRTGRGTVRAVDGVDLELQAGETLALVGESGSGKTTTLTEILELRAPQSGLVEVFGDDVARLGADGRRSVRRRLQPVLQDAGASLDPRMPVGDIVAEPLRALGERGQAARARVPGLLPLVGLAPEHAARFPRQLSGGEIQRVAVARALATEPEVLLLDEPVSALDATVQAGILDLLRDLQDRLGLAVLLVAHDLTVVRSTAHRVAVMHLGRVVETGTVPSVLSAPAHPYTQALVAAAPVADPDVERARPRVVLRGEPLSAADVPAGCRFRPRCPLHLALDPAGQALCHQDQPLLPVAGATGTPTQHAACHVTAPGTPR